MGCIVQYSIAPDKLYSSWMVYDALRLLLTALNAGQRYYVRINSFNKAGVTEGAVRPLIS